MWHLGIGNKGENEAPRRELLPLRNGGSWVDLQMSSVLLRAVSVSQNEEARHKKSGLFLSMIESDHVRIYSCR